MMNKPSKLHIAISAFVLCACLTGHEAFAQQQALAAADPASSSDEIKKFCTNIADPARDQRYLLQKQELQKLQSDVDARIAILEKRKTEYEDWLKRRDAFMSKASDNLVEIYKSMKPDSAAQSLESVRIDISAAIIMKMPARQSSLVLAAMTADKAAAITNIMASASDPTTSSKTAKQSKDPT